MLYYAFVFLIISLVAGVLGFKGLQGIAAKISTALFVIFGVLFLIAVFLIFSLVGHSNAPVQVQPVVVPVSVPAETAPSQAVPATLVPTESTSY